MASGRMPPVAGRPWVAASLMDFDRLQDDARRARRDGADLLEVRADAFPPELLRAAALGPALARVRRAAGLPVLLTVRARREGGRLPRNFSEPARLALVRSLLPSVDAVDVEGAAGIAPAVVRAARRAGRWTVVSQHDFKKTPPDRVLKAWTARFKALGGDLFKVAAAPRTPADVRRLMAFCASLSRIRRAFISMGTLGKKTRTEGGRWGSCLTYGYVRSSAAPGQIPVKRLAEMADSLYER
jgi:3-dehydroquinate dehydratase-1